jgi:hypothetical protein
MKSSRGCLHCFHGAEVNFLGWVSSGVVVWQGPMKSDVCLVTFYFHASVFLVGLKCDPPSFWLQQYL